VTEEVGLLVFGPTQTAAWADYDGDGWLDLFVGHESRPGSVYPCQLFHNDHDGTFTEVKAPWATPNKLGVNLGFVKGVAWGDYNNDGRPDLYVPTMFGQSFLFRNDGPRDPKHPDTGEGCSQTLPKKQDSAVNATPSLHGSLITTAMDGSTFSPEDIRRPRWRM
jgi:hypothetical protein